MRRLNKWRYRVEKRILLVVFFFDNYDMLQDIAHWLDLSHLIFHNFSKTESDKLTIRDHSSIGDHCPYLLLWRFAAIRVVFCTFWNFFNGYSILLALLSYQLNHCTMVIIIREGRKKFGYSSKPNSGGIINAKNRFLAQNGIKMR